MVLILFLVSRLLDVFVLIILIRAVLTWFPNIDRSNPTVNTLIELIHNITEPVLRPIRERLPPTSGMDFSPLVVIIAVQVIRSILLRA